MQVDIQERRPAASSLRDHLERLREEPAYRHYQRTLAWVLAVKDRQTGQGNGAHAPSDYWQEELANFQYMLDASPLIINTLRHHCFHLTGERVYDYRSHKDIARKLFTRKLATLKALEGPSLLIPESRALGGFGFEIDGELYNIDTLKFYEALIALHRGAVLQPFLNASERRVVWEIGAGWGGFAYQFKTLCPNATYIVTDFPEVFLFSAVYLLTMFPDARAAFWGEMPDAQLMRRWNEFDFVFIPTTHLEEFAPPRLDLTINMVSFQEMTSEQVRTYVRTAFELRCPFLYSLNRDRSPYNRQLTNCHAIAAGYYWPHEIPVLDVNYGTMVERRWGKLERIGREAKQAAMGEPGPDYRHVIGWRRDAPLETGSRA